MSIPGPRQPAPDQGPGRTVPGPRQPTPAAPTVSVDWAEGLAHGALIGATVGHLREASTAAVAAEQAAARVALAAARR